MPLSVEVEMVRLDYVLLHEKASLLIIRARLVLVQGVLVSFHTQRGQLTDSASIAHHKKRLVPRRVRSIRKQPVINRAPAGHFQRFKHPHVTRSPPKGVEKLSGVFLNVVFTERDSTKFNLRTCSRSNRFSDRVFQQQVILTTGYSSLILRGHNHLRFSAVSQKGYHLLK